MPDDVSAQSLYQLLQKLQLQLCRHEKKIHELMQIQERSQQYQNKKGERHYLPSQTQQQKFVTQLEKSIEHTKMQFTTFLQHYQQYIEIHDDLDTRFNILKQSYKQSKRFLSKAKSEFNSNKIILSKNKKYKSQIQLLQNEYMREQGAYNKLQTAYNNSLMLQNTIKQKISNLDQREIMLVSQIEVEINNQVVGEAHAKKQKKFNQLINQKQLINRHMAFVQQQLGGQEKQKSKQLIVATNKANDLNQFLGQMQINIAEQQLIIKQIMTKQKVSNLQLYQQIRNNMQDLSASQQFKKQRIHHLKRRIYPEIVTSENYFPLPPTNGIGGFPARIKSWSVDHSAQLGTKALYKKMNKSNTRNQRALPSLRKNIRTQEPNEQKVAQETSKTTLKLKEKAEHRQPIQIPVTHLQNLRYSGISHFSDRKTKVHFSKADESQNSEKRSESKSQSKMSWKESLSAKSAAQFVRMKNKQGNYVYKNIRGDQTLSNINDFQPQSSRNKSQIVSLYEKLININKERNEKGQEQEKTDNIHIEQEGRGKEETQHRNSAMGSGIKLSVVRKKKKQGVKYLLESRQSDGQKSEQKNSNSKLNYSVFERNIVQYGKELSRRIKTQSSQKQTQQQVNRKRLKTIHQREEEPTENKQTL